MICWGGSPLTHTSWITSSTWLPGDCFSGELRTLHQTHSRIRQQAAVYTGINYHLWASYTLDHHFYCCYYYYFKSILLRGFFFLVFFISSVTACFTKTEAKAKLNKFHTVDMVYCLGGHQRSCSLLMAEWEAHSPEGWRKLPGLAGWGSALLLGQESPRR